MPRTYVFDRSAAEPAEAPRLDPSQQAVVDHAGGPLLVLAGPGTGKTTTLVEAVVDRIDNRGVRPEEVLVLTFSRKAAEELRTRIGKRLGRTTTAVPAMTFHSFCYGLVREFQDKEAYSSPLTLLSAGEQDWRIQEVVTNTLELGSVDWPEALRPALATRGLARELQALMARARSLGMEPKHVSDIAVAYDRPDWAVAAKVFEGYLTNLDYLGQVDYSEVVYRAVLIALHEEFGPKLRGRYKLVVVDEYQDTDPLQVRLLQALAGGGRDLIAVGDPDQSIYAFRGADIRGIYDFGDDFATAEGPAPALALTTTRRFGPVILSASRSILGDTGRLGRIDTEIFDTFRNPESVDPEYGDGEVSVCTYATAAAEAEHIALLLREAHLRDELPWHEMAVLVRSGTASLPRLQRALVAAG
ncbi:MAG: UvrD-helicase domain-containing protein, partial [Propionibacteriales bacterium]|nr:UvrD-helicase domain-containing protein [Propionibacteriales bacterium]